MDEFSVSLALDSNTLAKFTFFCCKTVFVVLFAVKSIFVIGNQKLRMEMETGTKSVILDL